MKIRLVVLVIMAAAIGSLQAGTGSAENPGFSIVSPDHPATWEVGFNDKVGQSLRWSEGQLILDVTYSRITYTDTIPPSDFKTYTVAFPGVSMDGYGNLFVLDNHKHKVIIGGLASGPLGRQVALNRGVDLSAHRQHGRINAMLLINNAR